ncbi:hypothetical protein DND36_00605 [Pseudomonas savastanoi pv. glycinea]|nr:hypothetical protein DND36_00605 [Pseudomonas savastanoi pv. glycinea]
MLYIFASCHARTSTPPSSGDFFAWLSRPCSALIAGFCGSDRDGDPHCSRPSSWAVRTPSRASSLPRPLSRCEVWLAGDTLRDIFVLQVHRRD